VKLSIDLVSLPHVNALMGATRGSTGTIPRTTSEYGVGLKGEDYVPNEARSLIVYGKPSVAVSNSLAFGGHNVALVPRGAPV
jgi:hypothetical protein